MNKYKKSKDAVIPEDLEDYLRISTNRTYEDEYESVPNDSSLFHIRVNYGGFDFFIWHNNSGRTLEASDVYSYDSPERLLLAFAALIETGGAQWILFPGEPYALILKLERVNDKLIAEVYDTDRESHQLSFDGSLELRKYIRNLKYKADLGDIMAAARALRNEFGLYKNGVGRQSFDRYWGFPATAYERLLDAIRGRKSEV
jgi:hypothetical protein